MQREEFRCFRIQIFEYNRREREAQKRKLTLTERKINNCYFEFFIDYTMLISIYFESI